MKLTNQEKAMLDGDFGPGTQRCMDLLVRLGEMFDAEEMVRVNHVHFSSSMPNELLHKMSEGVEGVRTVASIHAAFDPTWFAGKFGTVMKGDLSRGVGISDDSEFMQRVRHLSGLGFLPTFTCAPYVGGILPRPGDVLCWTGSSGQVICNSLFSTRSGRESAATCFAAAITGKTPYMGLLKKENRHATVLVELQSDLDMDLLSEADYGALGYFIGEKASYNNIAIKGIPRDISFEKERMLLSPLPVSGSCTICHIIGVTPEAHSLKEAFGNKTPEETIRVGLKELKETCENFANAGTDQVDMVALGCPHLTISEIAQLTKLLTGERIDPRVKLLIGISNPVYSLASDLGYAQTIERAGGTFMNICVAASNRLIFPDELPEVVATNSARAAHYIQRMTAGKSKVLYGDMKQCTGAAISGTFMR